ncbi:MAG: AI-2E family transporter [Lentisphaerae bacterium]|nr:MAG: AI-2E family transporter [Lentisphaerota bacterium]
MPTMNEQKLFQVIFLAGLSLLGIIVVALVFWQTRSLWSPCICGLLMAYLLFPIILKTDKIGIPRWITVIVIMVSLIGTLVSVSYIVVPLISDEIKSLRQEETNPRLNPASAEAPPNLMNSSTNQESTLLKIIYQASVILKRHNIIKEEWHPRRARVELNNWLARKGEELVEVVGLKAIQVGNFLMIFSFVLIFGLLDGDKFYKNLLNLLPNSMFEAGIFTFHNATKMFGNYLRGVVIETILLGLICFVLLLVMPIFVLNCSFVVLGAIAFIIAVTNIVRIVGPIFGAVLGALIAFSMSNDVKAMIFVLIVAAIVQLLDNLLVLPLVMEDQMAIHPVFCLLGVLSGGILGGVLGMALAIPVIGGIKILYRVFSVELHRFHTEHEPGKVFSYGGDI